MVTVMAITENPTHDLTVSDLTANQLTELQIFAAYSIVGAVKAMVARGDIEANRTLTHFLGKYEEYGDEMKSRRTEQETA